MEKVYHTRATINLSYLHQPAINLDLHFHLQGSWEENIASWNSDEGWTCVTQEEAGFKYLPRLNLLLQLHTLENPFKVIQSLQSHGLKFTMARSYSADTSYSGVTPLTLTELLRFKPEAKSRLCCFLEMEHSQVKMCLLIFGVAPAAL